jgi:hypothetical protein
MKDLFLISILLLSILSSPASAALYETTWTGEIGTWSVDYNTANGTIGTVMSQTGQYYYTGQLISGGSEGPSYTDGDITYRLVYTNYAGFIDFLFPDGNRYTAQGTSHNTYLIMTDSKIGRAHV